MVGNLHNQLVTGVNEDAAHPIVVVGKENERLMKEYMVPPVIKSRSSLAYLVIG